MTVPVNISVLVPVYNVEPYLVQCLESICSQTLRELEVVCVDDASTDGSLSILREFAERDPRVKVVQAPENGGLSRSRNLAMNHAYLTVAELVLKEWKEAGILEEYRTAFLKMLVMGVRNIRKYAPHAVQKEVTRKVADMLCQENLYRPGEDDSSLSRREGKLLKTWMGGKSGLDFSYYWKRIRKAGARLLRR